MYLVSLLSFPSTAKLLDKAPIDSAKNAIFNGLAFFRLNRGNWMETSKRMAVSSIRKVQELYFARFVFPLSFDEIWQRSFNRRIT